MAEQTDNMAVEMVKEQGIWAGLDVAAAPLRVLHQLCVERNEGEVDPDDQATMYVLERCLEDLDAIGAEARDDADRRLKSFGRALEGVIRELKPDVSDQEVSRIVGEVFCGRRTKKSSPVHAVS